MPRRVVRLEHLEDESFCATFDSGQRVRAKAVVVATGVQYRRLPIVVVLAVLLTARASDSLTKASENKGQNVARVVAIRLEDWIAARHQNLTLIAGEAPGRAGETSGG